MSNNVKVVFNVPEVCNYLHTSQSSIRKLVRTNQIPHYRILSRIFFDKQMIDAWINNQQINNFNNHLLAPMNIGGEKCV